MAFQYYLCLKMSYKVSGTTPTGDVEEHVRYEQCMKEVIESREVPEEGFTVVLFVLSWEVVICWRTTVGVFRALPHPTEVVDTLNGYPLFTMLWMLGFTASVLSHSLKEM